MGAELAQPVQRLGYGLDDWGSTHCRGSDGIFSLHFRVESGSEAHSGERGALTPGIKR